MKEYIEKTEAVERALYTPIMSSGAVCEKDRDAWTDGAIDAQEQIAKSIGEIPAADVVERKRGEWVSRTVDREVTSYIKTECGNCNFEGELWYNFCPNCGADMRKTEANHAD